MGTPAPAAAVRYVELVRVSGQSQYDRDTPAQQREALDRLRETRPGILLERIEEPKAVSGATPLDGRHDLQRLLELARERAFDEVRVRHFDRIQRTPSRAERGIILDAIAGANARIVESDGGEYDPNTDDGDLMLSMKGSMANRERNLIRTRTTAGKRQAAKGGRPFRPPYARTFDHDREGTEGWGRDEAKLAIYKSLFERVKAGEGQRGIARDLNARGVPAPGGGEWTASKTSRLLKDTSAYGVMTREGIELSCPPIVDKRTWDEVQALLNERDTIGSGSGRHPKYEGVLLRGLVRCASCGGSIVVKWSQENRQKGGRKKVYYTCSKKPNDGCVRYQAHVDVVDEEMKRLILDFFDKRDVYRRSIEHMRESDDRRDYEAEAAEARKELDRLTKEAERHGRLILRGLLDEEEGEKLLSEIQGRKRDAQAKLDRASMSMEARGQEEKQARRREAEIRLMKKGIKHADFQGWRKLVVAFVEWMTKPPAKYGSKLALTADGTLKLV